MTVSLKPLFILVEAFLSLSLKPSLWMFMRLAPGELRNYISKFFLSEIAFVTFHLEKAQITLEKTEELLLIKNDQKTNYYNHKKLFLFNDYLKILTNHQIKFN